MCQNKLFSLSFFHFIAYKSLSDYYGTSFTKLPYMLYIDLLQVLQNYDYI